MLVSAVKSFLSQTSIAVFVREFHAIRNAGLCDFVIWVDRSDHLPAEDKSSNTLEPWMADYIIDNNDTLEQLYINVDQLYNYLNFGDYSDILEELELSAGVGSATQMSH